MSRLEDSVDRIASETGFSGVVRIDREDGAQLVKAYGHAHRGRQIANAVDTQFAIASGTKGLTALTVVSLIEEGRLEPTTTARSLLAEDLPLIDDEVTVEQLLAQRLPPSGARKRRRWHLLHRGGRPCDSESMRYGLGFWLGQSRDAVMLEGFDAGVSFRTVRHRAGRLTHTVLSNSTSGAWPITRHLDELLVGEATG